jgi:hypothetical protein
MDRVESEKLAHFADKFRIIERLRVEQKEDVKAAVDAALAAQKEAIGKSEAATKEQIAGLGATATTAYEALRRDIDDLKNRLTVVEATSLGQRESRSGFTSAANLIIAVLVLVVGVTAIIVTVILANAGQ